MTIQEQIKTLLKMGYSQQRVAEVAGVSQATISRLQSGKHGDTTYRTAKKIEEFLILARSETLKSAAL